ncbi:MAG: L,D-transpeptidase family protein [Gammaproteobacteria bacterium]|nr:L,D-transpeptidase family protein [Gammaproteobacteria bacterium]
MKKIFNICTVGSIKPLHIQSLASLLVLACTSLSAAVLPGNVFTRDASDSTTVVVDKERRSAYLVDISNDEPRLIRQFDDLLFGENGGDKIMEGDKKTPEGVYRVTSFIPKDKLAPIYGSGAFPIDYPNPLDRAEGRNGSGIWLHGRDDNDPKKQVTRGCVAFNNSQISELQSVLKLDTPVIITQNAAFLSPTDYDSQRQYFFSLLDRFINHWEAGDLEAMDQMIHPEYRGRGGMDKQTWLKRKADLAKDNPQRRIETGDLYAFRENGEQLVFDFSQFYCARNIASVGRKRIYFKKDGDQLKMVAEQYTEGTSKPLIRRRVSEFLQIWRDSWQNRELDLYIQNYSRGFQDPKGRDLGAWRQYKQRVFTGRSDQKITIDGIQITPLRGNLYRVSFEQHYQSDQYTDIGIKTLELEGCPGAFHIVSEQWEPKL